MPTIEFNNEELTSVFLEHLQRHGFSTKHVPVKVRVKTKFLGKGKGSEYTVIVDIGVPTKPQEPEEEGPIKLEVPIFEDDKE